MSKFKIVLISIFCVSISPVTMQNDTYYTIKVGEHISKYGVDMKDPFSWHENLSYTYPHWLYDVGTYLVYQLGENIGIGGFTAIYILTVLFICKYWFYGDFCCYMLIIMCIGNFIVFSYRKIN